MSAGHPLCKITGSERVERMKERIWRIQLVIECLERSLQALKRLADEFEKPEEVRDEMVLESLTLYSVIQYAMCFESDLTEKLDAEIFSASLPSSNGSNVFSEREFHTLIMNYRKMHLAHSDQLLTISETGGIKLQDNDFGVGQVTAFRPYQEGPAFYESLHLLVAKSLEESRRRISTAQQQLMEAIQAGEAVITDEEIALIPTQDKNPRGLWGLPSRS